MFELFNIYRFKKPFPFIFLIHSSLYKIQNKIQINFDVKIIPNSLAILIILLIELNFFWMKQPIHMMQFVVISNFVSLETPKKERKKQ